MEECLFMTVTNLPRVRRVTVEEGKVEVMMMVMVRVVVDMVMEVEDMAMVEEDV